jgi:hypothetical protein
MSNSDFFIRPKGEIQIVLHNGGTYDLYTDTFSTDAEVIESKTIPNLIVSNASILMAMRMAPGVAGKVHSSVVGEKSFVDYGLGYLAVGTGSRVVNPSVTSLASEVTRKPFKEWVFIDPITGGVSVKPTNILKLSAQFMNEPHGGSNSPVAITEMGIFGGTNQLDSYNSSVTPIDVEYSGGGIMFNYKAFEAWNKPFGSTLTINWKITF